jgi:ABC-type polysaccharide/polyol phosphate transport system ATPase subunit
MTLPIQLKKVTVKFKIYRDPLPSLKDWATNHLFGHVERNAYTEFFALNNIDLDVREGTRLGILGMNGAGKSTLLKTIAGIYHPHEGMITVRGRLTPLMELGAGFDPNQTGRENIYLNGAMLGFSPSEMKKRETSIAEFSELKDFLDLPVKYYSTGMYGRLAFSIATMTDPQILLIDEVFATGDAHFVEKSSRRILDLVERSKAVLIVSHNMEQIQKLCSRVVVLHKGKLVNDGKPSEMIDFYTRELVNSQ